MNFHPATGERREFLKISAASVALSSTTARAAAGGADAITKAAAPLNILILGGTGFTGPDQVRYALARGHKVTLLNRNSRPGMFAGEVEQLVGDLGGDLSALKGKRFDVVIDNPTTLPAWVRNAAQYLKGNTKHYIFISTISTYRDNSQPNADETAATTPLPDGLDPYTLVAENAGRYYGALKSFSEKEVETHYPGIATIIRPGLIVGPLDQSDRFTYWPVRIAKGGKVLAPGTPSDPTQYIDARDIAEWTVRMAEQRAFGIYNAMGPDKPLTMSALLSGIQAGVRGDAAFVWVPADFLDQHKVGAWINMPVWVPPTGDTAGFMRRSNAAALAKGLTFRPLPVTAADTLAWHKTRPAEEQARVENGARAGISAAREAEVLAAWAASGRS
ncbi:MAG: NAD-dependent epimerase/dehydratase family protein [Rhodospirillaceae bacterium]